MSVFDFFKGSSPSDASLKKELGSCKLRISTLEKQNIELAKRVAQLQSSLEQTHQIINVVAVANAELAKDMKIIYDSLQAIVTQQAADDHLDEMLLPFGWPGKDDDDLPN